MAVLTTPSVSSLSSLFPLTNPIPNPKTHPDLLQTKDLHREEDLLRNPTSFRAWWTSIQNTKEILSAVQKANVPDVSPASALLLGPLATPSSRLALQRLTYLYESALINFPTSFKLWKAYLQMRCSYVQGRIVLKKRAGGKKKLPEMGEALEDEKQHMETWEGGLDGVVGWEEWRSLCATFERALMWLPNVRLPLGSSRRSFINFFVSLQATSTMADVPVLIFAYSMSAHSPTLACTSYL
jgi:pre-mRNA-splicing factor SYF1